MVGMRHYANANGNILLSKGANLMQPPTRLLLSALGVAFFLLWTATQNISNPTVIMSRIRPASTLVV